jgi:hypothetical protein
VTKDNGVILTAQVTMEEDELKNLKELRNTHLKRLRILELQAAKGGRNADPEVLIEIEELRATIADIEQKLAAAQQETTVQRSLATAVAPSSVQHAEIVFRGNFDSLTPEIRNATIRALAAVVNIPPEQITVLRVIPGSIVYQLTMPVDAAQLLLDLYASNDPILVELEIEQVHIGSLRSSSLRLERADLAGAYLVGAHLAGAHLREANLTRAHLMRAHLEEAQLTGANLRGAKLTGADLTGANLAGADLWGRS